MEEPAVRVRRWGAAAALATAIVVACAWEREPGRLPVPASEPAVPPCAAVLSGDDPSVESLAATPPFWVTGVLVDGDDRPVPNTVLRFSRPDDSHNALTRPDGRFEFAAQKSGESYDVDAVTCDDGSPSRDDRRVHLGDLVAGSDPLRFRITIPRTTLAEGIAVDEDGRALDGHAIEATPSSGPVEHTIAVAATDRDGRFRLTAWNDMPVTLAVVVHAPNRRLRTISRQETDAETGEVRIVVGPPSIEGLVTVRPLVFASNGFVDLKCDGRTIRTTPIHQTGRFRFDRVDPSLTYELAARVPGHVQIDVFDACRWGEPGIDLRVHDDRSVIAVRITRADGGPPRDTWVNVVRADARAPSPSDGLTCVRSDGTIIRPGSPGTEYDVFLAANAPDGRPALGPKLGRVRAGERDVTLRLPR